MEKVSGKEESNLKPFGLMAKFQIQMSSDNKVQTTIKIATGRWEPFKQGKPTRIKQFKQLSEEQGPVVFAGDTNLRKGEIRFKNDYNNKLEPLALRIEAKEKYNDLIREERPSGCLSDHYGLRTLERDSSSDSESDN
ncbi:hypothetical protein ABK040_012664 [Willaertia magna]